MSGEAIEPMARATNPKNRARSIMDRTGTMYVRSVVRNKGVLIDGESCGARTGRPTSWSEVAAVCVLTAFIGGQDIVGALLRSLPKGWLLQRPLTMSTN